MRADPAFTPAFAIVRSVSIWDEVGEVAQQAVRDPSAPPQRGATAAELRDLESRLGRPLPRSLVAWLLVLNGDTIGEGGVFGARPDAPALDIGRVLDRYREEWDPPAWLPVASDGCGNYYLLLADEGVGFVDTMADPAVVSRVVEDSLVSFLLWYLPRS